MAFPKACPRRPGVKGAGSCVGMDIQYCSIEVHSHVYVTLHKEQGDIRTRSRPDGADGTVIIGPRQDW